MSPLVETDPAVLAESQPAVDRVAHLPLFLQRRQGEDRADAAPPRLFDGGDEVDPGYPRAGKQRGGRNRFATQPSEVVAPRPFVAQAQPAVHLAHPLGFDRTLPEAPRERVL